MSITAPTESAAAYYVHRALDGKADQAIPRADGVEYVFNLNEVDLAMWPELGELVRLSVWRKANGDLVLIPAAKIPGGVVERFP